MNFFPSRVNKKNKTKQLFRTILTKEKKENSSFLDITKNKVYKERDKIPAKLQETEKKIYNKCRNLVQNSEIKVKKKTSFMCIFANVS